MCLCVSRTCNVNMGSQLFLGEMEVVVGSAYSLVCKIIRADYVRLHIVIAPKNPCVLLCDCSMSGFDARMASTRAIGGGGVSFVR